MGASHTFHEHVSATFHDGRLNGLLSACQRDGEWLQCDVNDRGGMFHPSAGAKPGTLIDVYMVAGIRPMRVVEVDARMFRLKVQPASAG